MKRPRVTVAGFFDPLHEGHLELISFASWWGAVTVITHTAEDCARKSGFYVWPTETKLAVLKRLKDVEHVVLCTDADGTIRQTLKSLQPMRYVVGGDWSVKKLPEQEVLDEIGCEVIYCGLPKINASSSIKDDIRRQLGVK